VRAAMVAAMANGMLHVGISGRKDIWNSPGEILRELNVALQPRMIREMFTSMSLSILQTSERRLIFSNAGIPYPIIKRGEKIWELKVNGLPLGIVEGAEYSELGIDLESGDLVVFCSDGIIEAANEAGEFYETERLLEVMQRADPGFSAQEMLDWILKDVTAFAGGDEPSDDITIIVLRCGE